MFWIGACHKATPEIQVTGVVNVTQKPPVEGADGREENDNTHQEGQGQKLTAIS